MDLRQIPLRLVWMYMVMVVNCQVVRSLTCGECSGVIHPRYCVETINCLPDEECYTEKVIGDDFNIFYNSGCLKRQICQLSASQSRTRRSQIHVCEECCGLDMCNLNICNQTSSSSTRQCYTCTEVSYPHDCHNKVTCGQDEECFTQEYVTPTLQKRYRLDCESRKRCELLNVFGRRHSSQLCNECCSGPGCNRHLCPQDSPTVRPVIPDLPIPCVDHASVDCASLTQSGLHPCNTVNHVSTQYCPHYCGYC